MNLSREFLYEDKQFGFLKKSSKRGLTKKRLLISLSLITSSIIILTVIVIVVLILIPVYLRNNNKQTKSAEIEFILARIGPITTKRTFNNNSPCSIDTTVINKNIIK